MKMTKKEYNAFVEARAPKSPVFKNMLFAFLIGGAICTFGQLVMNGFKMLGLEKQEAGTATSVSMVFLGVLLTSLSLYDNIAKRAGAGTLVPITGFANAVSSAAIEFRSEGFITGMAAKMFIIAGPVIVYGTTASVVYGIIYYIIIK